MSFMDQVKLFSNKAYVKTQKHAPDILIGASVVGVVATGILAARGYQKARPIIKKTVQNVKDIDKKREETTLEEYPLIDYVNDMKKASTENIWEIAKPLILPVTVGTLTITVMLLSHRMLTTRNIALTAAYAGAREFIDTYRDEVRTKLGEEAEREVYTKTAERLSEEHGKSSSPYGARVEGHNVSDYAKWFDESSTQYIGRNPQANLMFLKAQQNYWNDMLISRGHVFLNEVYESLGLPHTPAGAMVGWVYSPSEDDSNDQFIDFGIYNGDVNFNRDFVNGLESKVLLDFNIDGIIWNMI